MVPLPCLQKLTQGKRSGRINEFRPTHDLRNAERDKFKSFFSAGS